MALSVWIPGALQLHFGSGYHQICRRKAIIRTRLPRGRTGSDYIGLALLITLDDARPRLTRGEAQRSGFEAKKEESWSGQDKNQSEDWFLLRKRNALRRGAVTQIRTGDLILTKDALYRLSYNSKLYAPHTRGILWRPRRDLNPRPPA